MSEKSSGRNELLLKIHTLVKCSDRTAGKALDSMVKSGIVRKKPPPKNGLKGEYSIHPAVKAITKVLDDKITKVHHFIIATDALADLLGQISLKDLKDPKKIYPLFNGLCNAITNAYQLLSGYEFVRLAGPEDNVLDRRTRQRIIHEKYLLRKAMQKIKKTNPSFFDGLRKYIISERL